MPTLSAKCGRVNAVVTPQSDTGSIAAADSGAALLISPVRRAIVDALANHRPVSLAGKRSVRGMTASQLGVLLDLHVTTVRFHLDQLEAGGLVTSQFARGFGVGRPRKVYDLTPGSLDGDRHGSGLQLLTTLFAESFGKDVTPTEAGVAWARDHVEPTDQPPADSAGRWLTKVGQMVDVLEDWGYTPDVATSEGGRACRIDLVQCPFLDLARSDPAVVCGIHRGLIAGAMEQLGEPNAEVSLEPFVEPELCRAHVRTRTPFRSRTTPPEGKP